MVQKENQTQRGQKVIFASSDVGAIS